MGPNIRFHNKISWSDFYGDQSIINTVGYTNDGCNYIPESSGEKYLTFGYTPGTERFSIVSYNEMKEEMPVYVWYMDTAGNILDEFETTWDKGSNTFALEEVPGNVSLISLSIDVPFDTYMVVYSNKDYNLPLLATLLVIYVLIVVVFIVLSKLGKCKKVLECTEKVNDKLFSYIRNNKKQICKFVISFVTVFAVAVLVAFVLSKLKITICSALFSFNYKSIICVFLLLYLIYYLIINRKSMVKKLHIISFFVFLLIGIMYSICEPAFAGVSWDDEIHYDRSVDYSHIIDRKELLADEIMSMHYQNVALDRFGYSKEEGDEISKVYNILYKEGYYNSIEDYKVSYSQIVYIPAAIGLAISRSLFVPYSITMIIGKLFSVLLSAILCSLAARKLKNGGIVVMLIALIPTNVFLAGNFSYDMWLTSWSILGLSFLFSEMQNKEETISKKSVAIITISLLLAPIVKQIYFILTIPAFFMSAKKFENKRNKWLYRLLIVLAMITPFILMFFKNIVGAGEGDARGGSGVNSAGQLQFIKSDFGGFITILMNFLKVYLNPVAIHLQNNSYLDNLGYNGYFGLFVIILPIIVIGALLSHRDVKGSFPIWYRLGIICIYIGVGTLSAVAMYVSFTPVGAEYIAGCQGRYLIPALFPTLYVLTRIPVKTFVMDKIGEENINMVLLMLMGIINIYCIYRGCVIYY